MAPSSPSVIQAGLALAALAHVIRARAGLALDVHSGARAATSRSSASWG